MDHQTELLISLASASAANCIPCFDHYYQEAENHNVDIEEIRKTIEISEKIKSASALFTKKAIHEFMGEEPEAIDCACYRSRREDADESCC